MLDVYNPEKSLLTQKTIMTTTNKQQITNNNKKEDPLHRQSTNKSINLNSANQCINTTQ